ncbi:MAG: Gfo/Idh/MocA family oxidoreductase [Planctomycetes bacterium]|nr:Gfo/Idh/MocA family oxidoreductase [Planctomycetota bacterium]
MTQGSAQGSSGGMTRRDFVKSAAATVAGAAAMAAATHHVHAAGSDKIRFGLIGCGRRGTGAANDCLGSAPNVEIAAVADLFPDRAAAFAKHCATLGEKSKVTPETTFSGFDAYQKLVKADLNVVLICTPPGFRPGQLKAAIEAGKHVFMEKPVGVDPAGIRTVLAAAELADQKKLGIVAGTQRRHQATYVETLKRIHAGDIGDVTAGQVYWVGDYGYYPAVKREPGWADLEWQVRNWNYFTWLSGDHIVEQHVHNIDIMCWVMKGPPRKCIAVGGRQQRTGPEFGHIYDHFGVEFEYDNGVRWASYCRQNDKTAGRVSEHVAGTKGMSNCAGYIGGAKTWNYQGEQKNPYVQEHADLIASIRDGKPLNEGRTVGESTLAAIMGRMSAYTGRELNYSWVLKESKLDLMPPVLDLGASLPPVEVAVPGVTPLV